MYISRKTKANSFPVNREVSFSEFSPCFCYCLVISNKIKIIRKVIGSFSLSSLFRASTSSIIFFLCFFFLSLAGRVALTPYSLTPINAFSFNSISWSLLFTCLSLHKRFFSDNFFIFCSSFKRFRLRPSSHHSINVLLSDVAFRQKIIIGGETKN